MIPKIIHQIWIGSKDIPEKFRKFRKKVIELHPDWQIKFWSDDNIVELLERESAEVKQAYNVTQTYAGKVDIIRYLALKKLGGVYIDIDIELFKPLDELQDQNQDALIYDCPFVAGDIQNCVLGFSPNHKIFDTLIDDIWLNVFENISASTVYKTGPFFLQKHLELYNRDADKQIKLKSHKSLDEFMKHHFTFSWQRDAPESTFPLSFKKINSPVTTLVWFSCNRDFNCLKLSIESAKKVMQNRAAYYIVADSKDSFWDKQILELQDLGVKIYDKQHSGMFGLDAVRKLIEIFRGILSETKTPYVTKTILIVCCLAIVLKIFCRAEFIQLWEPGLTGVYGEALCITGLMRSQNLCN